MNLHNLIASRRTVHQYTAEAVPHEWVYEALRLSLWAPNHKLTYPWQYVWLSQATRSQFVDLAIGMRLKSDPSMSEAKRLALRQNIMGPAHIILLGLKRTPEKPEREREREDYATLAASVQIASLALWENKVGTKWSTGSHWMHNEAYKLADLNSQTVSIEGALMIGYAAQSPNIPQRPDLESVLKKV